MSVAVTMAGFDCRGATMLETGLSVRDEENRQEIGRTGSTTGDSVTVTSKY